MRNTTVVPPPKGPEQGYHLARTWPTMLINWLLQHKAFQPNKPFYMYWASGAIHGPQTTSMKEWLTNIKGKFCSRQLGRLS